MKSWDVMLYTDSLYATVNVVAETEEAARRKALEMPDEELQTLDWRVSESAVPCDWDEVSVGDADEVEPDLSFLPLKDGAFYFDGFGDTVSVVGAAGLKINRNGGDWVVATSGNWYDRATGRFVGYGPARGRGEGWFLLDETDCLNIKGARNG